MCITGLLGIPGSRRERTGSSNCFAGAFMGFSITSAVFGGVIIFSYSLSLSIVTSTNRYGDNDSYYEDNYEVYITKVAVSAVILVLGIAEFTVGIWAAICCCVMDPCACCAHCSTSPQQMTQQVVCTANTAGYIMTTGPDGIPMAVPAGTGMAAVQASGAQGGQVPMVLVPASGALGAQPYFLHAGATSTGYPLQQTDMLTPYGGGQNIPLPEQIPVKT